MHLRLLRALSAAWLVAAAATAAAETRKLAPGTPLPPALQRGPAGRVYDLARCLDLAEKNFPKIHEARAKLRKARAQVDEAHTEPFSNFTIQSGVGAAPTVLGTSTYSPNSDVALTSNMALAWQVGIEGAIPLWTFGKISSVWDAADAQVRVTEHEVAKERNEIRLQVRQAYWGVLLARDATALVEEAMRRIDKYTVRLEKKVEDGDGDDIELLKLRMNRADLDARLSEAKTQERIALVGLRFFTGVEADLDVPDVPLEPVRHSVAPLAQYLTAARLYRPEVNMARAGVVARQAQVRYEQARYYPDLALAVSAKWARAPEITDQLNPFVRDQANFLTYGAALVLRWKLDFLPQSARVAQAHAELEKIRATERFALGGVGAEVERAFTEANDAKTRLDAYTRATRYAKQWLIKVQQGIDVGTFDDEDIVDPSKEYALKRFAQMKATFEYNVAVARLSLATGWEPDPRG